MQLSSQQFVKLLETLRSDGRSSGSEKRRFTRMEVQAQVQLATLQGNRVTRQYTGLSRDISQAGISLIQCVAFARGEKFVAKLPCGKEEVVMLCEATFCRPLAEGVHGVGAQFVALADQEIVDQVMEKRGDEVERIRQSVLS